MVNRKELNKQCCVCKATFDDSKIIEHGHYRIKGEPDEGVRDGNKVLHSWRFGLGIEDLIDKSNMDEETKIQWKYLLEHDYDRIAKTYCEKCFRDSGLH